MKRRTAIRNVILVSAGAAFLNACQDKASTTLKHIPLTGSEEEMLSELTETILPKTDFPGAKDLKSADFVFMMADDCLDPEDQAKFSAGMKAFDEVCKTKMGSRFVKLSPEKRNEFLGMVESDKEGKELGNDLRWFYGAVKQGTIQNFTTSKEYLNNVRNITTLIPPRFKACVPVVNA
jgi:Gluconate 2-dehydrogenase subunit 3